MKATVWVSLIVSLIGAVNLIYEGLAERSIPEKERGPIDVLAGCVALVICGFACYWTWNH